MQHMRAPRPAYLPNSLPPSLSLALSFSRRVGSFATLIKRSGLCHTWHAADNSRASVRLRLLPAWPAACVLHPASCLLPPGCCLMPPVIYALNNVAFASSRPSPCRVACAKKNATLSALLLPRLLLRRHVWHVAATRDAHRTCHLQQVPQKH